MNILAPQYRCLFVCIAMALTYERQTFGQETIEDLEAIEEKVQKVVTDNMESCVAISDRIGFGSGVIINEKGLILTAGHVISPRGELVIIFPSGRRARAKSLGRNLSVDAGMAQILEPGPWPFVKLADSPPENGEWVVALGHSGGFELGRKPPVRTGRALGDRRGQLVTDATLIGGDSGGPLFNLDGELVAIHSSIGDNIAQNRHVYVSTYEKYWDRMLAGESWGRLPDLIESEPPLELKAKRPRMGVTIRTNRQGAVVSSVQPNGPAQKAGIQPGDRITQFNGIAITSADQLIKLISTKQVGQVFEVEFQRNRVYYKVEVRLAAAID
ncbi:MAG: S1C family serine protease [Mariniblastus sp.]|nr:S1C family serine protease [Mariniblastus sp.]